MGSPGGRPGLPVHHQLPEFAQTEVHQVSDAIQPSLSSPSIFPSIGVFSKESVLCIRWPKDWSCSLSIGPSTEHPGLISFRRDWLGLLAAQGTRKRLLQHHIQKHQSWGAQPSHLQLGSNHTGSPVVAAVWPACVQGSLGNPLQGGQPGASLVGMV